MSFKEVLISRQCLGRLLWRIPPASLSLSPPSSFCILLCRHPKYQSFEVDHERYLSYNLYPHPNMQKSSSANFSFQVLYSYPAKAEKYGLSGVTLTRDQLLMLEPLIAHPMQYMNKKEPLKSTLPVVMGGVKMSHVFETVRRMPHQLDFAPATETTTFQAFFASVVDSAPSSKTCKDMSSDLTPCLSPCIVPLF